ncbi:MAG: hypothetical protein H8D97_00395 [Proteobacteria bacterium]|nr:hypothetical protein [Pseudomonadota bacterium]
MEKIINCRLRENGKCCILIDICEPINGLARTRNYKYRQEDDDYEQQQEIREFKELYGSF